MYLTRNVYGSFGFKDPRINTIDSEDVEISNDIYNQFFQNQEKGKQFILKNINGANFDEIFEEIVPTSSSPLVPTLEDRIKALEDAQLNNLGI